MCDFTRTFAKKHDKAGDNIRSSTRYSYSSVAESHRFWNPAQCSPVNIGREEINDGTVVDCLRNTHPKDTQTVPKRKQRPMRSLFRKEGELENLSGVEFRRWEQTPPEDHGAGYALSLKSSHQQTSAETWLKPHVSHVTDEKEEQDHYRRRGWTNTQPWPRRGEPWAWEHTFHLAHISFEVCDGPTALGILICFECVCEGVRSWECVFLESSPGHLKHSSKEKCNIFPKESVFYRRAPSLFMQLHQGIVPFSWKVWLNLEMFYDSRIWQDYSF